jgi:hypothetical protein
MPLEERVAQVIDWFSGHPSTFPDLVNMYFEQPDSKGHEVGPFGDTVKGFVYSTFSCLSSDFSQSLLQYYLKIVVYQMYQSLLLNQFCYFKIWSKDTLVPPIYCLIVNERL